MCEYCGPQCEHDDQINEALAIFGSIVETKIAGAEGGGGKAPSGGGGADDTAEKYLHSPYPPNVETFVWRANGPTSCPICVSNELEGPVLEGHVFPSGHTEPPAHWKCMCVLERYIEGHSDPVPRDQRDFGKPALDRSNRQNAQNAKDWLTEPWMAYKLKDR